MRVSTVVLALSCLVTGYALVGTRVKAFDDVSQARRFPSGIGVGAHVRLTFSGEPRYIDCTIARVDAGWLLCAPPRQDPFNPMHLNELWYDLAHVASLEKVDTQR